MDEAKGHDLEIKSEQSNLCFSRIFKLNFNQMTISNYFKV